jgi:hypothetical protein
VAGRWEGAPHETETVPEGEIDPTRPAVIARCLDQLARAVEKISATARGITLSQGGR